MTFIKQGCIKLIKSDRKDINNVKKISILNKCLLSFLFIKEKKAIDSSIESSSHESVISIILKVFFKSTNHFFNCKTF